MGVEQYSTIFIENNNVPGKNGGLVGLQESNIILKLYALLNI